MNSHPKIAIATNNGDIGGGEAMLFNIARALRKNGVQVTVVGPAEPSEVVDAATDEGFDVVTLPARDRKSYLLQLRAWDATQRKGILWCNGMVPSFSTGGHKNRIVHLHQLPKGKTRFLTKPAQWKALVTLLPSQFAAQRVKDARPFHNWVEEISRLRLQRLPYRITRIGFLGRPSSIKGTHTLAQAIGLLNESGSRYTLHIAGEPNFIDGDDAQFINAELEKLEDSVVRYGKTLPAQFFDNIDLLVVPSVWNEVFGLVATEAMSARVPLIISDAGALPEILGADYPWIFSKGNAQALAAMITQVSHAVVEEPEKSEEIVSGAYWNWYENFSPEAGVQRVQHLIDELTYREQNS